MILLFAHGARRRTTARRLDLLHITISETADSSFLNQGGQTKIPIRIWMTLVFVFHFLLFAGEVTHPFIGHNSLKSILIFAAQNHVKYSVLFTV